MGEPPAKLSPLDIVDLLEACADGDRTGDGTAFCELLEARVPGVFDESASSADALDALVMALIDTMRLVNAIIDDTRLTTDILREVALATKPADV